MKTDNPFDKRMKLYEGRLPPGVADSLAYVCDNLDWSQTIAQAVFEKQATPEHALEICKMLEARQSLEGRKRKRTAKD